MDIIKKYFNLSFDQEQKFNALQELYSKWNSRINVISRKDLDNLYEHHVLHSLGIAKVIHFKENTSVMDIGTGGGFPGIPLAIMFPESNFLLTDSIGKKIKVVNAIIEELGLKNTKTVWSRAEQINEKFDFVVCRAVTDLPELYKWVGNKIKIEGFNELPNGIMCLKGNDVLDEFKGLEIKNKNLKFKNRIFDLKDFFTEEFFKTKKLIHLY